MNLEQFLFKLSSKFGTIPYTELLTKLPDESTLNHAWVHVHDDNNLGDIAVEYSNFLAPTDLGLETKTYSIDEYVKKYPNCPGIKMSINVQSTFIFWLR